MNNQLGVSKFSLILILVGVGLLVYFGIFIPQQNKQALENVRSTSPTVTIETRKLTDDFKAKSEPSDELSGTYVGTLIDARGNNLSMKYHFGKDFTLTKEVDLDLGSRVPGIDKSIRFAGSAKYSIEGSTLVFEEVVGDRALFSEIGEPISVHSPEKITIYEVDSATKKVVEVDLQLIP